MDPFWMSFCLLVGFAALVGWELIFSDKLAKWKERRKYQKR